MENASSGETPFIVGKPGNAGPEWTLDNIVGYDYVKNFLKEHITLPLKYPQLCVGTDKCPSDRVVVIYGPPGMGKTMFAKNIAGTVTGVTLIYLRETHICSRWYNPLERILPQVDKTVKAGCPCLIVLDQVGDHELDEFYADTTQGVTKFMQWFRELPPSDYRVMMIICTQNPHFHLLHPNRHPTVYVKLPSFQVRKKLIKSLFSSIPHDPLIDSDWDELALNSKGWSCSDISVFARSVSMVPVRRFFAATHFKKVKTVVDREGKECEIPYYYPCSPDDPEAVAMKVPDDIPAECCPDLPVTLADMHSVMSGSRSTIGDDELKVYEDYHKEFCTYPKEDNYPKSLQVLAKEMMCVTIGFDRICRVEELKLPKKLKQYLVSPTSCH